MLLQGVALTARTADTLRRHVGLLTESPGLWERLSVRINLLTYARLYSLPHPQDAVRRILDVVAARLSGGDAAGPTMKETHPA